MFTVVVVESYAEFYTEVCNQLIVRNCPLLDVAIVKLRVCLPVRRVGMFPDLAMLNNGSGMAFVLDDTADNRYCS